jgi:hypothetical protein
MELTYAWDVESWKKSASLHDGVSARGRPLPYPVPTLDVDDEIVFMASDATRLKAPPGRVASRRRRGAVGS